MPKRQDHAGTAGAASVPVQLQYMTFDEELCCKWESNVKSATLAAVITACVLIGKAAHKIND